MKIHKEVNGKWWATCKTLEEFSRRLEASLFPQVFAESFFKDDRERLQALKFNAKKFRTHDFDFQILRTEAEIAGTLANLEHQVDVAEKVIMDFLKQAGLVLDKYWGVTESYLLRPAIVAAVQKTILKKLLPFKDYEDFKNRLPEIIEIYTLTKKAYAANLFQATYGPVELMKYKRGLIPQPEASDIFDEADDIEERPDEIDREITTPEGGPGDE